MQLALMFNKGAGSSKEQQKEIKRKINNINNEKGYKFCDLLEFSVDTDKVIIKVSFPRYYYANNAYLVESSEECLKVQKALVTELKMAFGNQITGIKVERVDIPFTYIMEENAEFTDYNNTYKVAALMFKRKYKKSRSKSIIDTLTEKRETVTYTDSKTKSAYNKRIMIYDQYQNLKDKLGKDTQEFKETKKKYPNLKNRMRIEVSKRIDRKPFTLKEFSSHDFFKEYSKKYKKFLLEDLFNSEILDKIYKKETSKLAERLKEYRERKGKSFKYETFITAELKNIYDYEILREAMKTVIKKKKTLENGITSVRDILKDLEKEDGLRVLKVKKDIVKIEKAIKKSFKKKRSKEEDSVF